jgi:hypothetical protein
VGLNLSRQADAYGPAYAAPYTYPYLYAPPVHVVTTPHFGRRSLFGRGGFSGFHTHHRPRHFDTGLGRAFSLNNAAPSRNSQGMARALPTPAGGAPRRRN